MKKVLKLLGIIVAVLSPAAWMTYQITRTPTVGCEVCMEFRGRSQCRKATGPDQPSCKTTATDNACAFLASGMTDSIKCTQGEPVSVQFLGTN
ncbi:MAG TPA: hypothetical protein VI895_13265 [Bdellovibrionota bacterium]|nr:hypothetical protein [Bdellovibrionota bacterium]